MGASYDVVILGATGFTGQIAAQYMARAYPPHSAEPVRWAIAGRSRPKLQGVFDALGLGADAKVDMIVCDLTDREAVERVVKATSVVANYAGTPFVDKALPVVELCSRHGTHYVDITGELPLHRASYDLYDGAAKRSGAVVLHGCGFDSVPSDIGAFLAAKAMRDKHGCACSLIKTFYGDSRGGLSGGTLASGLFLMGAGDDVPGIKASKARGAYALDPEGAVGGRDVGNHGGPPISYDALANKWVAPFVMAAINAPVVRKSNALLGYRYGERLQYAEVMTTKSLPGAVATFSALCALGAALVVPPVRWLLFALRLLPSPGEGPSKELMDTGFFKTDIYARGESGKEHLVAKAHVNSGSAGDPGYRATALMSIECALCLALQRKQCSKQGGVLTPAVALGDVLVDRLNKAGMDVGTD